MIRRWRVCAVEGVAVRHPAALTSIQKEVRKDLRGQGQGCVGVGGGVSAGRELLCVCVCVCACVGACLHARRLTFIPGRLAYLSVSCLCVCLFYKLLLIASLQGQLELRSNVTQPPSVSLWPVYSRPWAKSSQKSVLQPSQPSGQTTPSQTRSNPVRHFDSPPPPSVSVCCLL